MNTTSSHSFCQKATQPIRKSKKEGEVFNTQTHIILLLKPLKYIFQMLCLITLLPFILWFIQSAAGECEGEKFLGGCLHNPVFKH